jgi:hypothetical protein
LEFAKLRLDYRRQSGPLPATGGAV